jgi:hypothetical protein
MTAFKLKRGKEIEISLVSSFKMAKVRDGVRKKFIEEHGEIEPPSYAITLGGGGYGEWTETRQHTADTIGDGTREEKAAWKKYCELRDELNAELWRRTAETYLFRGVVGDPPDDGWEREQEEDGIEVPDEPRARKLHWIETELLTDNQELFVLIGAIQGKISEVEEAAQVAAAMFQRQVGEQGRDTAE